MALFSSWIQPDSISWLVATSLVEQRVTRCSETARFSLHHCLRGAAAAAYIYIAKADGEVEEFRRFAGSFLVAFLEKPLGDWCYVITTQLSVGLLAAFWRRAGGFLVAFPFSFDPGVM